MVFPCPLEEAVLVGGGRGGVRDRALEMIDGAPGGVVEGGGGPLSDGLGDLIGAIEVFGQAVEDGLDGEIADRGPFGQAVLGGEDQAAGAVQQIGRSDGLGEGLDAAILLVLKRFGVLVEAGRLKAPAGEFRNIAGGCDVVLSGSLDSGDPSPTESVAGGVAIEEVLEKEVGAEFPRQVEGENPDRGEPHTGVIVEVAIVHQFPGPGIEGVDTGLAVDGAGIGFPKLGTVFQLPEPSLTFHTIGGPHLGTQFEPAFPVGAPEYFLDEFLGVILAVLAKGCLNNLPLNEKAPPDEGGEAGDVSGPTGPKIKISAVRVGPTGMWKKGIQGRDGVFPGRF